MEAISNQDLCNSTLHAYAHNEQPYVYGFTEFDGEELSLVLPSVEIDLKTGDFGPNSVLIRLNSYEIIEMITGVLENQYGDNAHQAADLIEQMKDHLSELQNELRCNADGEE